MHESELKAVHASLIATGVFVPVPRDTEEQHRWMDYDLASFAENRLGEAADPEALDNPTRARWLATALDGPLCTSRQRQAERCYWIMHDRTRAGALALSRFCLGRFAMAYSVYLRPQHRGQTIMANAIEAVCAHLAAHDLGLRLETPWTWQRAVRFYLRTGFWLCSWKRDLAFVRRPRQPRPVVHVTPLTISVAIAVDNAELEVAHAHRDELELIHHGVSPNLPESLVDLVSDAQTTLALALALHGWPLVRSGDRFEQARYCDLVHPEALAQRIVTWEAWAADRGWHIATPRIPGCSIARGPSSRRESDNSLHCPSTMGPVGIEPTTLAPADPQVLRSRP